MVSNLKPFTLIGTGERFNNADGTSRQRELALCQHGEPVIMIREPANPRDRMAVALFSVRGIQIGYLSREHAQWIGKEMDDGREASAVVTSVASKGRPGTALALSIRVTIA